MGYDFVLVDVFSDRPFGGNQLAVFPDAEGIDGATMQLLAREFNFSETTFVLPAADAANTCQVRIFTPLAEIPFAGHPNLGTAAVLASGGAAAEQRFVFEEGIGLVEVTVGDPMIRLHVRSPEYLSTDEPPPAAAVARALTLPESAIVDCWYAGVGLPFCFVRLADRELVGKAMLDKAAWSAEIAGGWSPHLYVFAGDHQRERLYVRFFAPAVGVDEDAATGSGCASLVASLAQRSPDHDSNVTIRIDQGVAMGRPSVLEGVARKENGRLSTVEVGGQATIVGHGTMVIPS